MRRSVILYIEDILESIGRIQQYAGNMTEDEFCNKVAPRTIPLLKASSRR